MVVPRPGHAYDPDGHFYTVVAIEVNRTPALTDRPRREAALVAFCAQLPDLAKEFDAVSLRVRATASLTGFSWGAFSTCWGANVKYNHDPDRVLFNTTDGKTPPKVIIDRSKLWTDYIKVLAEALGASLDAARWKANDDVRQQMLTTAKREEFSETEMTRGLTTLSKLPGVPDDWAPFNVPVESLNANDGLWGQYVLKRSCADVRKDLFRDPPPKDYDQLDCDKIWGVYRSVAVREFQALDIAPICPAQ
ncbi:MAG: hypothetical protein DMD91_24455 [Candidatus Rokuibacteriota bacterium]|nr:MAG: hypothetical protein DMD91_24455 [Candidatus Rokubacteria bacterium]